MGWLRFCGLRLRLLLDRVLALRYEPPILDSAMAASVTDKQQQNEHQTDTHRCPSLSPLRCVCVHFVSLE
jgi:hypothetical protein